jgi:hypothetical protein
VHRNTSSEPVCELWHGTCSGGAGVRADPDPAAAPQLVAPWGNAWVAGPCAWAVLTAALDATLYRLRFRTRCRVSESLAEKLLKHGG